MLLPYIQAVSICPHLLERVSFFFSFNIVAIVWRVPLYGCTVSYVGAFHWSYTFGNTPDIYLRHVWWEHSFIRSWLYPGMFPRWRSLQDLRLGGQKSGLCCFFCAFCNHRGLYEIRNRTTPVHGLCPLRVYTREWAWAVSGRSKCGCFFVSFFENLIM